MNVFFCMMLHDLFCSGKSLGIYIPHAPKLKHGTEEQRKAVKRFMRHLSLAFFVKLFDKWAVKPFPITFTCATNRSIKKTYWFVIRMFTGLMDHPGAQLNSGYKTSVQARHPCRRCLVPHSEIFCTDRTAIERYGWRNHLEEDSNRAIILNSDGKYSKSEVAQAKAKLDYLSVQHEFPGLHREFPFLKPESKHLKVENLSAANSFETMHLFLLGAPKRIFEFMIKLLSLSDSEVKGTARVRADGKSITWCTNELDTRIAMFKSACIDRHSLVR